MRAKGTKGEDLPNLASRIIQGLRDDAFLVAADIGVEELTKEEGVETLVEAMRNSVFPFKEEEAKLLYKIGHNLDGILSRQYGEAMVAYISRRKRWYSTLEKLDDKTTISPTIRADLLLELSRLPPENQLMVKTSVNNRSDFDDIALALIRQHGGIHFQE